MAANGAMSVEGGNWQIFANMVASAKASVQLETEVTEIEKAKDGKGYDLTSKSLTPNLITATLLFDEVILASPLQYSNIDTSSLSFRHQPDDLPYVKLHVTLFTSPHLLLFSLF